MKCDLTFIFIDLSTLLSSAVCARVQYTSENIWALVGLDLMGMWLWHRHVTN